MKVSTTTTQMIAPEDYLWLEALVAELQSGGDPSMSILSEHEPEAP